MAFAFQFFQPYSIDKDCGQQHAEAISRRHQSLMENTNVLMPVSPAYLPINQPNGNGYVCLYVERGIIKGYYGPYIVTGSENCVFKAKSSNVSQDAEQHCGS